MYNFTSAFWYLAHFTAHKIGKQIALIGHGCLLVINGLAQKNDHISTTSYLGTDPLSGGLVQYQITTNDLSGSTHFFLTNGGAMYHVPQAEQQATSVAYLRSINSQVGFTGTAVEFMSKDVKTSPFGSQHYSFAQSLNGIPIYGADIMVHYAPNGQLRGLNGAGCKLKSNAKTASTYDSEGIKAAIAYVNGLTRAYYLNAIQRKLLEYDGPSAQLVYFTHGGQLHLCWRVRYCPNLGETWEVLVSASNLEVLHSVELSCYVDGSRTSRNSTGLDGKQYEIGTYKIGDQFHLVDTRKPMFNAGQSIMPHNPKGAIVTYQANGLTRDELDQAFIPQQSANTFGTTTAEKAAVSAHAHASTYYDKLAQAPFNYNSYDNKGSNITMYVGLQDPIKPFIGWENASWNGRVAFFGNGNTLYKSPLSRSLDIVAHELTHGLLEHGSGIAKGTSYQTAALIEALCDIMAMVVDGNFTIGENANINKNIRLSGLVRNAISPHNGMAGTGNWATNQSIGYTANHLNEFINSYEAAQYNSTIVSHAFYLIINPDQGEGIDASVASELFFDVVTNYLGSNANFHDFKDALLLAADIWFGAGSGYYNIIKNAFNEVGIETTNEIIKTNDLPALMGENYILSKEATADPKLLLFSMADAKDDDAFSQAVTLTSDASITDNGQLIYGVNALGQVVRVNYGEQVEATTLGHELGAGYAQVAVSRRDERLALSMALTDTSIHVYDRITGLTNRYKINTRAQVVHEGEMYPLRAVQVGVMEWDHFGTKVLFEYACEFTDRDGLEHRVWNIAELKVWDSTRNDFIQGSPVDFYQQLSSGLDLRFPSFAKNSPDLMVHDAYDKDKGINTVLAWNRAGSLAELTEVLKTKIPAHASYTNTDSGLVITDLDENGNPALYLVQLKRDKVTVKPGLTHMKILADRQNPRWFTVGVRVGKNEAPSGSSYSVYPIPARTHVYVDGIAAGSDFRLYDQMGREVKRGKVGPGLPIHIGHLPTGPYSLCLVWGSKQLRTTIVKN